MVVKDYIKKLQKEERYDEIEKVMGFYKIARREFLELEIHKKKDNIFIPLIMGGIICIGLFIVLINTNILIQSIYILPQLIISIITIKAYCIARKDKFSNYKSQKRNSVWMCLNITSFLISAIPMMGGMIFSITTEDAIKLFVVLIIIFSVLGIVFYIVAQRLLLRNFTKEKENQSKKINSTAAITGAFTGLSVVGMRNYLTETFLLIGAIGVSCLLLGLSVYECCEYSLIKFIEDDESLKVIIKNDKASKGSINKKYK